MALSYTWGDSLNRVPVIMQRHSAHGPSAYELKITTNLHSALWQIRQMNKYRLLCADAICINQENLHERMDDPNFVEETILLH